MKDEVYLIYYDNNFVALIDDDESFWFLYERLSDSDGVCNVVHVDREQINIPDEFLNFNRIVSQFGSVSLDLMKISVGIDYDDALE